jgi:alpha-N-acetylglucosamine transferase
MDLVGFCETITMINKIILIEEIKDQMPRYAWVTYVSNDKYLQGAIVLFKSLHSESADFVLMMPQGFAPEITIPDGMTVKWVKSLEKEGKLYLRSNYKHAINKIHIWTLDQYDKVCWLDTDMLVLKNIDHLFDIDIPIGCIAAAPGCTCNYFENPKLPTSPRMCPFKNKDAVYINTGLILIKPNKDTYDMLLKENYDYPFSEQDAFNIIFRNRIIVLDVKYNYLNHLPLVHPEIKGTDIHVFHFCYGKPWEKNTLGVYQEYYELWRKGVPPLPTPERACRPFNPCPLSNHP